MPLPVAVNGFGRIGRNTLRAALAHGDLEIVAVNDIADSATLAHLLKYDSVYGRLKEEVKHGDGWISAGGRKFRVLAEKDPAKLPWKDMGVRFVVESTGMFTDREAAAKHLAAGAERVVISAPAKGADATFVMGVNHKTYDPAKHRVVSNASCTTNCLAPVAKVLSDGFGVKRAFMTTVHAYTNDQRILDLQHKDLRRARSAAVSIIPTSTGAAKAIGEVLPQLKGKMDGIALRVPVQDVSMVDLVAETERAASVQEVNGALKEACAGEMKGILGFSEEPLVSVDFVGDPRSSIVDGPSTNVLGGNLVKVFAWYDNEWGYSSRLVDLIKYMGSR